MSSIDTLCTSLGYMSVDDIQLVRRAYRFAEKAHRGQIRRSGEPYITHPLKVAVILAEFELDCETILSALLHDVLEDTSVTADQLS